MHRGKNTWRFYQEYYLCILAILSGTSTILVCHVGYSVTECSQFAAMYNLSATMHIIVFLKYFIWFHKMFSFFLLLFLRSIPCTWSQPCDHWGTSPRWCRRCCSRYAHRCCNRIGYWFPIFCILMCVFLSLWVPTWDGLVLPLLSLLQLHAICNT